VRNLLLNQAILVASLAAAIMVPRFARSIFEWALDFHWQAGWIAAIPALLLLLFALGFTDRNIADFSLRDAVAYVSNGRAPEKEYLARARQGTVLWLAVLPIFVAAVFGTLALAQFTKSNEGLPDLRWWWWVGGGALAYPICRAISIAGARIAIVINWWWQDRKSRMDPLCAVDCAKWSRWQRERKEFWEREDGTARVTLRSAPFAGMLGGVLLWQLSALFRLWACTGGIGHLVSWGPPLLIAIVLLTGVLHVGLMGYFHFPNQKKEWWSRLAAWLLIWTLGWTGLFALALFAPFGVLKLTGWVKTKVAVIVSWLATTLYGVLAGKSAATSGEKGGNRGKELLASIAPYVFIIGLLVVISFGIHALVDGSAMPATAPTNAGMQATGKVQWTGDPAKPWYGAFTLSVSQSSPPPAAVSQPKAPWSNGCLAVLWLFLVVVACALAWRVDINEFSLHLFYRNRLVRCYLGATNPARCPHPFTGFDPTDDFLLQDFVKDPKYSGPYPIFNAAMNISHGQRLAWQERRAESFVFTPNYCGFDFQEERRERDQNKCNDNNLMKDAYVETCCYAYPGGPYLGTSMAISGAAVNPNMGYHASPPVAFLLTVFNVRLGWWMGNPRNQLTWQRSTPRLGLFYLLRELFGLTDDTSRYVNLSDGWHFENLGLYELVRRKCKNILVCDVGADASFGREDLGNAVRKCRSDFGAEIDLDASPLCPQSDGFSKAHFAAGTVRYPDGEMGRIIYIKSALTGSEPQDILAYKVANPAFPHQGTGDQWFDESQFESYRALGRYAIESTLFRLGDPERVSLLNTRMIFEKLS
jgi:hypothetical protein